MTQQVAVPGPGEGAAALIRFAHTYAGYERHGGLPGLSRLSGDVGDHWERTGELPDDLDVLRACLFFAVRAHRHGGGYGEFDEIPFVTALAARIRQCSDGVVPVHRPVQ